MTLKTRRNAPALALELRAVAERIDSCDDSPADVLALRNALVGLGLSTESATSLLTSWSVRVPTI